MRELSNGIIIPPGVDPEDLETLVMAPLSRGIWFRCPICQHRYKTDVSGIEPCCTGPNFGLDEHPMEIMERER